MIETGHIASYRHSVGARIRELRLERGLSQYKFAKLVSIDRTYLIGIEKGRRNVSIDNLAKISLGLGIMPDELLRGLTIDVEFQE